MDRLQMFKRVMLTNKVGVASMYVELEPVERLVGQLEWEIQKLQRKEWEPHA